MKISFVADNSDVAQTALKSLKKRYDSVPEKNADTLIVLGGDGFMLETMHKHMFDNVAFYGMNCGSIGFLLNKYQSEDLEIFLQKAKPVELHPLTMEAIDCEGNLTVSNAINEVSLFRETRQAAKIKVLVDGIARLDQLICDGILASTPAGSTAYNLSAHGPILPIESEITALTPISPFRPRRWKGALLPSSAKIVFEILENKKRPVLAAADFTEVRNVQKVSVYTNKKISLKILFDSEHNLEERILNEQFMT